MPQVEIPHARVLVRYIFADIDRVVIGIKSGFVAIAELGNPGIRYAQLPAMFV